MNEKTNEGTKGSLPNDSAARLQDDAIAAPEGAWLPAIIKSAISYLAVIAGYLGAVEGLVIGWKKFVAQQGEPANSTIYVLAAILAMPLIFAFMFNLLPALRRKRERELRPTSDPTQKGQSTFFQTSPRVEDPFGFFASGYEGFLGWASAPRAPLLHLTGASGSGKSSLVAAYLRPKLAALEPGSKSVLLIVRSYHDPLAELKKELLTLWKKKPDDYDAISALTAITRATRQLAEGVRLLIVFDQFEEFFLLRAQTALVAEKEKVVLAESDIAPLRDFLATYLAAPPLKITIMLSYREDQRRLLANLNLPLRQEGTNWMSVDPFDFATAAQFLRSCPGLTVPEARMDRVLREAARQEGGRVVMRPIVANLLGIILRQMSGNPASNRRNGDLLRGYVRDWLGIELRDERARIFRALLTDSHTARPRSVEDIGRETGLDVSELDAQLDVLSRAGLVRCLNIQEASASQRIWQISHDFVATLVERVLDGMHRSIWRLVRPWAAPLALVAWLIVVFGVWPFYQKASALQALGRHDYHWNESKTSLVVTPEARAQITGLSDVEAHLRILAPPILDLSGCIHLESLKGIDSISELHSLNLSGCRSLTNIESLKGLPKLQFLNLSSCPSLKGLSGLGSAKQVRGINLENCRSLESIEAIYSADSLVWVNLLGCDRLTNDVVKALVDGHPGTFVILPDGRKTGPEISAPDHILRDWEMKP